MEPAPLGQEGRNAKSCMRNELQKVSFFTAPRGVETLYFWA